MAKKRKKLVAVGYCRTSTKDQRLGIGVQREAIMRYAKVQGMELVEVFVDRGRSGKDFKRPAFERMMGRIDADSRINTLIVQRLDRLGRNVREVLATVEDALTPRGVSLVATAEGISTVSGPVGKLFLTLLSVFAEMERQRLIERVGPAMRANAEQGRPNCPVPFGYRSVAGRIEAVAEEAQIVREIFNLYCRGEHGAHTVARMMREKGYTRTEGRKIDGPFILRTVSNPFYRGRLVWNRQSRDENGKLVDNPPSDWVVVEDNHPALIDEATFRQAALIRRGRGTSVPRLTGTKTALTGILYCGHCGAKMRSASFVTNQRTKAKTQKYFCPRNRNVKKGDSSRCPQRAVRTEIVDDQVIDRLGEELGESWIEAVAGRLGGQLTGETPDDRSVDAIKTELREAEAQLDHLLDAYLAGRADKRSFKKQANTFRDQIDRLRQEQAVAEAAAVQRTTEVVGWKKLRRLTGDPARILGALDPTERRWLLQSVVGRVVMKDLHVSEVSFADVLTAASSGCSTAGQ